MFGGAAGGGKSWSLLLEPLRWRHNKDFGAVIFRRTYPEIMNEGGLWDESRKLYSLVDGVEKIGDLSWTFPKGSAVSFGHLQYETDLNKWQGSQIALIEWDELTHFTEYQFWYMLSRNRSTCGIRPYMRAGCNPDASSWVAKLVDWWIDHTTGFAIPERAGKLRWFIRDGETLVWGDDHNALAAEWPGKEPKSFTFIPSKVTDNKILMKADPGYIANLEALPRIERERLLKGNWLVTNAEGEWPPDYFGRHLWFPTWPELRTCVVIAWDPSKGGDAKFGDYSAFTILVRDEKGRLYADGVASRKWPVETGIDILLDLCALWHPIDGVVIEVNQFQHLIKKLFVKRAMELGVHPPVYEINNSLKKEVRIKRIGTYLAERTIQLKGDSQGARLLGAQLMSFPNGEFDDLPDSLEMGIRTMIKLWIDKRTKRSR